VLGCHDDGGNRCAEALADLAALRRVDPKAPELRDEQPAGECFAHLDRAGKLEARGDIAG